MVGDCHAASVRFVFPRTVYTRTLLFVLRFGVHVTIGTSFDIAISARRKSFGVTELFRVVIIFCKSHQAKVVLNKNHVSKPLCRIR